MLMVVAQESMEECGEGKCNEFESFHGGVHGGGGDGGRHGSGSVV